VGEQAQGWHSGGDPGDDGMMAAEGSATQSAAPSNDLVRTTARHAGWAYVSFVASKLLTFVATVILARILVPSDFGLVGFALVAMQYLDIVNRFGLDTAIVSWPEVDDDLLSTTFWFSLVTGFVFYATAWIAAPAVAEFFGGDGVTDLLRVIALVLVIESFSIVHGALLRRDLRFKAKLVPDVIKGSTKGVASIGLALAGAGAWSLAWGQVIGALCEMIALFALVRFRPGLRFDWRRFGAFGRYGFHMISVELLAAVRANVDYLFVGRVLGRAALGAYTLAYRLPELVIRSLNGVVGSVAHPMMARLQDDRDALARYYRDYVRVMATITVPAGVGIALIADPFVRVVYGERWESAIVPMQGIGIAMAISSIGWAPGVLYKAINRPALLNAVSVAKVPLAVGALWWAAPHGINTVAWTQVALASAYLTIDTVGLRMVTGIGFDAVASAVAGSICGALAMSGVAWGIAAFELANGGTLVLTIAAGGAAYAAMLGAVRPAELRELRNLLRVR
jgi:lipopolysaccharide exporter